MKNLRGLNVVRTALSTTGLCGVLLSSVAYASTCGDGTTATSTCSFVGGTSNETKFNPVDNDAKFGQILVTGGDTIRLVGVATDILYGVSGIEQKTLNDPLAAGPAGNVPRLNLGPKTFSVLSPDPITGTNITIATYGSGNPANFVETNHGTNVVSFPVNVNDQQYVDTRFGSVSGPGRLVADIGDGTKSTVDASNFINMAVRSGTFMHATGEGAIVEWASKNTIRTDLSLSLNSAQTQLQYTAQSVPTYLGTFTAFGQTHTVTNAAELRAYNDFLIQKITSGDISSQAAYDAAFAQAVSINTQMIPYGNGLVTNDDEAWPLMGRTYIMHADGAGSTAILSGQIDHRLTGNVGNAALFASGGGHIEITETGQVSGNYMSVKAENGSSVRNNGVISGGYFAGSGLDTSSTRFYDGYDFNPTNGDFVEAQTIQVLSNSTFENNGIVNVGGRHFANGIDYGFHLESGGALTNNGNINVAVNIDILGPDVRGVNMVNPNSTFTNSETGVVYIGRAAQYDVSNLGAASVLVANAIEQTGLHMTFGVGVNNGEYTIGAMTQNATAMRFIGNGNNIATSQMINNGVINIDGAAPDIPLMNKGMHAQNTAAGVVQNNGAINLRGVNAIGIFAEATGAANTNVIAGPNSVIDISGGADPSTNLRNYGVWVEGKGTGLATASIDGDILLRGDGAVGVHARGKSVVNVSAGASPQFIAGEDQIGFFIYGPDATIDAQTSTFDVSTTRSTLVRIEDGAKLALADLMITASGNESVGVNATGIGTVLTVTNSKLNVSGPGAVAMVVEGGAQGSTSADSLITLTGNNSYGAVVDGQKHNLSGANVGTANADTLLTNGANITSSAGGSTGFLVQNSSRLITTGDISSTGANSVGYEVKNAGSVDIDGSTVDVNGKAFFISAGTENLISTNSATVTGSEFLLDTADTAQVNASFVSSQLSGVIRTQGSGRADVTIGDDSFWDVTGSSNVTNLSVLNSAVTFQAPANGIFKSITVDQNLDVENSLFTLNTYLGDDSSGTDLIRITGDTSGSSQIRIVNAGGPGAATTSDGIMVVQVGGLSEAEFSLIGDYELRGREVVVGGAYAYTLNKNGIDGNQDGNWYLRSELIELTPDPEPGPNPGPIYQGGTPLYETYGQALLNLNRLPTLIQRVGGRTYNTANAAACINSNECQPDRTHTNIEGGGFWMRAVGDVKLIEGHRSTTGTDYELSSWSAQLGLDATISDSDSGKLIGGIWGKYLQGQADISSFYGNGQIKSDGYGGGLSLTWYGRDGTYFDAQGSATWYKSDLRSDDERIGILLNENDGFGYAFSGELGQRIPISRSWNIVPQAQLQYSRVKFDGFTDPFGADVNIQKGQSLRGRLGVAFERQREWQRSNGKQDRTNAYVIFNVHNEFAKPTRVNVSGTNFISKADPLWAEAGFGGSYNANGDAFSIYGEGSVSSTLNSKIGSSAAAQVQIGLRFRW